MRDNPVRRVDPTGYQGHDQPDQAGQDPQASGPGQREKPVAEVQQEGGGGEGKKEPTAEDRGGRGSSTMNMEYLSNGNTAGGATENYASELILGAGLTLPGGGTASSAGTLLLSSRFALFPRAEAGILLGAGLSLLGSPPPHLVLGTFHVANKAGASESSCRPGGSVTRPPAAGPTRAG